MLFVYTPRYSNSGIYLNGPASVSAKNIPKKKVSGTVRKTRTGSNL